MGVDIRMLAPAKVNFGLQVGPLRADGYHDIASVFQTVSLCDEITVRESGEAGSCEVTCNGKPMQEKNTVFRAVRSFAKVTGAKVPGVSVEIDKKIPIGGGLGGGSSDAAAVTAALEALTTTSLTASQKRAIAGEVGCDVYFFLLSGDSGCAVVTGRGDIVKPIRARLDLEMLLVFPSFASTTKEAYELLDGWRRERGYGASVCSEELEEVYGWPVKNWTFTNDFTPSLSGRFPTVGCILSDLRSIGASFCEMSGSGSTLYGVFDTAESIERARLVLAARHGVRVTVVHPFGDRYKMLD